MILPTWSGPTGTFIDGGPENFSRSMRSWVSRIILRKNSGGGPAATGIRRWHFLYFLPLPHVHGSFLPILPIAYQIVKAPTKVPTVRFYLRSMIGCKLFKVWEAAVRIELTNKGFAVLAKLFAQVQPCSLVSIFINAFEISSLGVIA